MALTYSGIVGYKGKTILPSVESWSTNNNILRDPPRSITTRRIDKVSDNSFLTQEIEGSADRIAENILAYPRGVNPMVGVSFGNYGSNGGIGLGQALLYRGQQSKLPYRIADRGAFRPPILTPVDLLPLSRMPRRITKINPIISNPDFTRRVSCKEAQGTIKETIIHTTRTAPTSQKIQVPIEITTQQNIRPHLAYRVEGCRTYLADKHQRTWKVDPHLKNPLLQSVIASQTRQGGVSQIQSGAGAEYTKKNSLLIDVQASRDGGKTRLNMRPNEVKQSVREHVLEGSTRTNLRGINREGEHGREAARYTAVETLKGSMETNTTGIRQWAAPGEMRSVQPKDTLIGERTTNATGHMRHLRASDRVYVHGKGGIRAPERFTATAPTSQRQDNTIHLKKRR